MITWNTTPTPTAFSWLVSCWNKEPKNHGPLWIQSPMKSVTWHCQAETSHPVGKPVWFLGLVMARWRRICKKTTIVLGRTIRGSTGAMGVQYSAFRLCILYLPNKRPLGLLICGLVVGGWGTHDEPKCTKGKNVKMVRRNKNIDSCLQNHPVEYITFTLCLYQPWSFLLPCSGRKGFRNSLKFVCVTICRENP